MSDISRDDYHMIRDLKRRVEQVEADNVKFQHFAFGNGEPGADERLRNIEASQAGMTLTLEKIDKRTERQESERRDAKNQYIGGRRVVLAAAALLSLVFGGGSLAIVKTVQRLAESLP